MACTLCCFVYGVSTFDYFEMKLFRASNKMDYFILFYVYCVGTSAYVPTNVKCKFYITVSQLENTLNKNKVTYNAMERNDNTSITYLMNEVFIRKSFCLRIDLL